MAEPGSVRYAELYVSGLAGVYADHDAAPYKALSFAERHAVWAGEHDAAAAASAARVKAEKAEAATARSARRASEAARILEIAWFLADNPGVDIRSLRPKVYPGYTYLPGQECNLCHGGDDDGRCLMSPECLFRYRAGFFTRQGGLCPWCGEPLPAGLEKTAVDHVIPESRGGPDREWNKQLLHGSCNSSKASRLTDAAYALAAAHRILLPDFLTVYETPAPVPPGTQTHLLPPLRWVAGMGHFYLSVERGGWRYRTLCGRQVGLEWTAVHGDDGRPQNVTCRRCARRREQLGPGTAPACPCAACQPLPRPRRSASPTNCAPWG